MKKIIMMLLMCIPFIAIAQVDSKYSEGAVTMKDNKVFFSTELLIPAMTKNQIFEAALEWANTKYQPDDKFKARVLFNNPTNGSIAIAGEEYMVFSSTSLSLDRTRIYYLMAILCEDGKCKIEISRIHYWYNEARDGGEKFTAEEWITDEVALNKAKTKLYPITGKFRRKTIDLKEELYKEVRTALGNKMISLGLQAAPVKPEEQVTVAQANTVVTPVVTQTPVITQTTVVESSTPTPVQAAKESVDELISKASRITLTAGGETMEIGKECWGGKNQLFGKDVTYTIIDTQKSMANMLISQNDSFTLSFYLTGNNEASVVFNCKKMMQQSVNGEEAVKMNPACDTSKSYNVYVGEIQK